MKYYQMIRGKKIMINMELQINNKQEKDNRDNSMNHSSMVSDMIQHTMKDTISTTIIKMILHRIPSN